MNESSVDAAVIVRQCVWKGIMFEILTLCLNISVLYLMDIIIDFLKHTIPSCLDMMNQHYSVASNLV